MQQAYRDIVYVLCSSGDCAWVEELKSAVFKDVTNRYKCSRRAGTLCMCSVALWAVLGLGETKSIICIYVT